MKIILTTKERLKIFNDALCNAGHFHYGAMDYEEKFKKQYEDAKAALVSKGESPSVEDIMTEIVRRGGQVIIEDREDGVKYEVTLSTLSRIENIPISTLAQAIEEEGDADTYDWVIEYLLFNTKIYG